MEEDSAGDCSICGDICLNVTMHCVKGLDGLERWRTRQTTKVSQRRSIKGKARMTRDEVG